MSAMKIYSMDGMMVTESEDSNVTYTWIRGTDQVELCNDFDVLSVVTLNGSSQLDYTEFIQQRKDRTVKEYTVNIDAGVTLVGIEADSFEDAKQKIYAMIEDNQITLGGCHIDMYEWEL